MQPSLWVKQTSVQFSPLDKGELPSTVLRCVGVLPQGFQCSYGLCYYNRKITTCLVAKYLNYLYIQSGMITWKKYSAENDTRIKYLNDALSFHILQSGTSAMIAIARASSATSSLDGMADGWKKTASVLKNSTQICWLCFCSSCLRGSQLPHLHWSAVRLCKANELGPFPRFPAALAGVPARCGFSASSDQSSN